MAGMEEMVVKEVKVAVAGVEAALELEQAAVVGSIRMALAALVASVGLVMVAMAVVELEMAALELAVVELAGSRCMMVVVAVVEELEWS